MTAPHHSGLESLTGIEPAQPARKTGVLPLNYSDIFPCDADTIARALGYKRITYDVPPPTQDW